MQLRRGQRDHPEVQKKCPDFGKKGLDCIHLWVKFSIPNVVLGASKRKKSKMFLYRAFFIVFDEMPFKIDFSKNAFSKSLSKTSESSICIYTLLKIFLHEKLDFLNENSFL